MPPRTHFHFSPNEGQLANGNIHRRTQPGADPLVLLHPLPVVIFLEHTTKLRRGVRKQPRVLQPTKLALLAISGTRTCINSAHDIHIARIPLFDGLVRVKSMLRSRCG